jgi:lactate permease
MWRCGARVSGEKNSKTAQANAPSIHGRSEVFRQVLTPVSGDLLPSFLVASAPIVVVLVMLGVLRRPAWQASLLGLICGLAIAVTIWKLPLVLALNSAAAGATFALWPVMWIVFNSLVLYNITQKSGRFTAFRCWVIDHLPNDRRIVLVVIGFCLGCLLEGVAGFGAPVAITGALLIALGFQPLQALVYTLMFNTAPVAFGALGVPVTTLAAVTELPARSLAAMIGRELPFLALLLPFYVVGAYAGWRSIKRLWPVLLVAGGSFACGQFLASNYLGYELTDVVSSLSCLVFTLAFLRVWRPPHDPEYALEVSPELRAETSPVPTWQGWMPWLVLSAMVIVWTTMKVNLIDQIAVKWPGLHNAVFITVYNKPYAAVWTFQPLASGTAILVTSLIVALLVGMGPKGFFGCVARTLVQVRMATLTVTLIVALAYVMNYAGMTYTLGMAVASVGAVFPFVSAFLGWAAVFLSGSDTSGNALFGNLQVVAARQLHLSPVLMAATNSSGGVMGKMISPQNIATGAAVTGMTGREGAVLARTFLHSIIFALLLGGLVMLQQYVIPQIIPA